MSRTIAALLAAAAIGFGVTQYQIRQFQAASERRMDRIERQIARDPYLGIPIEPRLISDRIRYTGNVFHPHARDDILVLQRLTPQDNAIIWSSATALNAGDELEIRDGQFHSLHAGTTFIKVKRLSDSLEGYITIETFIGETLPVTTNPLIESPITLSFNGRTILPQFAIVPMTTPAGIALMENAKLTDVLAVPVSKGTIHPVHGGNQLTLMLLGMQLLEEKSPLRDKAIAVAKRVFEEYVFPAKIEVAPGAIAWPNTYDFPIAWGGLMKAPWYSAYSNGVIATAAAMMLGLTGEEKYRDVARQAVAWMELPSLKGGAQYQDGPFSFVAEYPSASPQQPNIRILDGEMIAITSIYNVAVMLGDADMLQFAGKLAYSLASQIDLFTTRDGRIQNGRYEWLVNDVGYVEPMKKWAFQLGMITKDRRFFEAASRWRKSDVYWPAN